MNDLVEFLNARLDEREKAAREAAEQTAESWRSYFKQVVAPGSRYGEDPADANTSEVAAHIALNDPASVLRDIKSKRQIIEAEVEQKRTVWRRYSDEHRQTFEEWIQVGRGWSDTMRLLALPDADHLDYQEKWRPWVTR